MISSRGFTQVNMNNKMEETEEERAFLESGEGSRNESEKEEQTVCKKPRMIQDETAMQSQMPCDNAIEGLMDITLQKQDKTQNLDEPRPEVEEQNQNPRRRDTDNKKEGQIGQSEEDDVEAKRDEASSYQTGGEEGNERKEREKNEKSNRETSNDISGVNLAVLNEGKSRRDDVEVQEDKSNNEDSACFSITPQNTDDKAEELKDAKVDETAVNVGAKSKDPCERHLDEEAKTEDQKQKVTGELPFNGREQQGNDAVPEKLERDKAEHERDVSERDSDAEEKTEMEHSGEDNGWKNDTSNGQASHYISMPTGPHDGDMSTDESCATQSGSKSSREEKKQEKMSRKRDSAHFSNTQTNMNEKQGDAIYCPEKPDQWKKQCLDKKNETDKRKQTVTHPQRHYGLYNQGATCYLNSVLQVLFMTTEIHDRLDRKFETDQELRKLFENLKTEISGTENITKILGIENVFMQRDALKYLEMILLKISPAASEFFQGKLAHTTKCSEGHSINEEINPFWSLPLSLKDTYDTTYSVESSFESFFQKKSFSGDNKVYCNKCNDKKDATSECEMVKSPKILTLLLKRFDFDLYTMSYVKSHRCVEVPRELQTKNKRYKLYGMVNHMGDLYGGHYTATVLSNEDKAWYECNDCRVHKVQEQLFDKTGTFKSTTVYLLMYRATDCQMTSETNQSGDEQVTIPQEPTRESPGSKAQCVEWFLIVLCFSLWLVVIGLVLTTFLLSY